MFVRVEIVAFYLLTNYFVCILGEFNVNDCKRLTSCRE